MITFYADAFRTMGGWLWRARIWAHRHPVAVRILATVLLIVYFGMQAQSAQAAGFLPEGSDYADSKGNKFSQYSSIDIDPGDVWSPGKVVVNFVVQLLWSIQYFLTGVMLWLFDFLLSFQWVSWLAQPFNALAVWLQDQLGELNWIPFALALSALIGGTAIIMGRVAGGLWEMLVAAVMAVLAVGILANPVATLTATDGVLAKAQEFGGTLATSIVVDPNAQTDVSLSTAVNAALMDTFVRTPYQVISYAQVLPDDCQGAFDTFIQTGKPQASLRECAPDAAVFAHDNPGGMNILNAMVNGGGVSVMFIFGMVIAGLLMVSVVFFLIAGIKAMLLVYAAILPVNREPLWKAVSDMYMGAISLMVMTVCLALYLKLTTWIMSKTGFLPHQLRMILLILFLIIVVVLVWRARRATLRAGHGVAKHLSKLGMGMNGMPKDSNALLKMSTLANTANAVSGLMKRRTPKPAALPAAPAKPEADPITLTQVRTPGSPTPGSGTSGPRRAALGAAAGQKALGAASTVATVAKGAASGGVPGAIAAGAMVAGKTVVRKTASKATNAAHNAVTRGSTSNPQPADIGELKVVKMEKNTERRFQIDSKGVASVRRKTGPGTDIATLRPQSPSQPSVRAIEMRRQLEAFRPKALVR